MGNEFNPMAGFITDLWPAKIASYGGNPLTQFDLGGVANTTAPLMPGASGDPSLWEQALGFTNPNGTKVNGFASPLLSALQGFGNFMNSRNQFDLAKDQFKFQKQAFNQNYAVQRNLTNSRLEDRQRARVAANPNAYESVGDYMNKYKVA